MPGRAREPGRATVVAAILEHHIVVILEVDPKALSYLPLQQSEPEPRPDPFNDLRRTPLGGPSEARDVAIGVTPKD